MSFPGLMPPSPFGNGGGGGGGAGMQNFGMSEQQLKEQQVVKFMHAAMESCPGKTAVSGVMGFGLGGVFGMFMSSMRYDTPMSSPISPFNPNNPLSAATQSMTTREQVVAGFKDMGKASWRSAKNFGLIGAIFSGTECCIEGLRAKNDLWNGVAAGCLTGGTLAINGGPQAAAIGCAGFAAFSAAIDAYMRMPEDEKRKAVI